MSNPAKGAAVRHSTLGIQVLRATAVLPASATTTPYFTVTGGRGMSTSLVGGFRSKGAAVRHSTLGIQVLRATAVLPASATTTPYFTVTGGRVMITSLVGEFTTAMDAGSTTLKFSAVPTVGKANNMCAVSAALTSAEIGALLSLDGVIATALQVGVAN